MRTRRNVPVPCCIATGKPGHRFKCCRRNLLCERLLHIVDQLHETAAVFEAATLPPEAEDGLEKCLKEHGEALAPGALTDSMVVPLLRSGVLRGGRLVVKDPSRVLLTPDTLDKLQTRQVRLETAEAARTLCVTINPVSAYGWKFDKDEFMARMREAVDVPVINVKEELA